MAMRVLLSMGMAAWVMAAQPVVQLTPRIIATLEDAAVTESSGVVASRTNAGIYWTHNDSGDAPIFYAFDRTGKSYGRWTVPGATNIDWEDIAIGPSPQKGQWYLYAGDIGDNNRVRKEIVVYRVEEPKVGEAGACRKGCETRAATAFHLTYPDGPHNAETLLVHPATGDVYVISKANSSDPATTVYVARAKQLGAKTVTLLALATLDIPDRLTKAIAGGLTGGDISEDGRKLALCDYLHYYEVELPAGADFDDIWKQTFYPKLLGVVGQVEGICFRADGKAFVLTAEGTPCPVMEIPIE